MNNVNITFANRDTVDNTDFLVIFFKNLAQFTVCAVTQFFNFCLIKHCNFKVKSHIKSSYVLTFHTK